MFLFIICRRAAAYSQLVILAKAHKMSVKQLMLHFKVYPYFEIRISHRKCEIVSVAIAHSDLFPNLLAEICHDILGLEPSGFITDSLPQVLPVLVLSGIIFL